MNRFHGVKQLIIAFSFLVIALFPVTGIADFELNLQWEPAADENVAGYRLFLRVEGRPYNYDWPEWQGDTPGCFVEKLDESAVYYFVIRTFDSNGIESPDSNEVRLTHADLSH